MYPLLNTAIKAARSAGDIIVRHFDHLDQLTISEKQHNDFVTEADIASEKSITDALHQAYPEHAILAEEGGKQYNHRNDNDHCWIIDPLDGTLNFLHGFPHFSISIAMQHKGRTELAVIYDPIRQDLFTAQRGAGAHKEAGGQKGHRIRVANRNKIKECLIASAFPKRERQHQKQYFECLNQFSIESASLRRNGSAALDLAYIASGQLDIFWACGLKPWDMAAGALLVQESGGLVSDFDSGENFLASGSIVATNNKVLKPSLQIIKKHYQTPHQHF